MNNLFIFFCKNECNVVLCILSAGGSIPPSQLVGLKTGGWISSWFLDVFVTYCGYEQ